MMRKMKKWFSGFLCLTLLLGLLPTAAWAAEDAGTLPDETDLAALSESEDVDSASYDDNTVVTRAILAELIYQNETLQGVIGTNTSAFGFSDISGLSQEQQDAINAMANARFISGIGLDTSGDPLFSPSTEVTRADAAVIFWKLTGSKQVPLDTLSFTDVFATDWYAPAVAAMASAGLINGYSDGTFNPVGTATNPSRITVQELNVLIGRCTGTAAGEYTTPADFAELPTAATRLEMLMVAYERYKDSPLATVTAEEIDYADIDACTDEEREAIQFFTSRGVVRGYNPANNSGVNLFGPYDAVSNLQAAMFLYRCAMKFEPDIIADPQERGFYQAFLENRSFAGEAFTRAYYARQDEILPFLEQFPIDRLHLIGQESISSPCEENIMSQRKELVDLWLDFCVQLCEREELLSWSEHLLYIGRKRNQE